MTSTTIQDTNTASNPLQQKDFNLKEVVEDILLVLNPKEKDVIVKRFCLAGEPRYTLDKIGKHYRVTRERIRQIQNIAGRKLQRTVPNTKLNLINNLAKKIIASEGGGVMTEAEIVDRMLKNIYTTSKVDGKIIVFSMGCDKDLVNASRTNTHESFWTLKEIPLSDIKKISDAAISALKKHGDVMSEAQITSAVQNAAIFKGKKAISNKLIISCLKTDKRACRVMDNGEEKWGLMGWRWVNPKSIRDRAIISLEKAKAPLHFVEIANRISEIGFEKKFVTTQAVHNELIRYPEFVLVGRGLYALKEWGYEPGTVSDVIERLLKKNGPMSKKQIVEEVKKRRTVKDGTISLNLQKNPNFVRVGRAVYEYKN